MGAILATAPLFKNGLARRDGIVIDGKSGVTGAGAQGRKIDPMYLFTEANENVQAYAIGSHRHTPEIEQELSALAGTPLKVSFTPHLLPLNRGLFTTASVPLASALGTAELLQVYRDFYAGESFVRVLGEGERPTTRFVVGSNYCDVAVVADPRTNRAICVSAIDNLGKGGSANGVQNLNVLFGWDERTGLDAAAGVPLSRVPELEWLDGGITAVPGFLAGGVAGGIKPSGKKDMALIHSPTPARSAAVFTSNQVKGAPVQVSMEHARSGAAQAILASSGCSNVCTGERGVKDAREMTKTVADLLRIPTAHVLIAATGVIGVPLPMDRVRGALPKLVKALSPQGGRAAAEAIMTTDTRPKEAALRLEVNGRPVTLGGIAKGVGMIEPHLATMFCFVATDAAVARGALDGVVRRAGRPLVQPRDRRLGHVHQRHGGRSWPTAWPRTGRSRRAAADCGSSPPASRP